MDEEGEGYVDLEICESDLGWGKWKRLLTSRKVWLGVVGVATAATLYAQGLISAEQLVEVILGLVAAIIVAIGVEDHGLRTSGR